MIRIALVITLIGVSCGSGSELTDAVRTSGDVGEIASKLKGTRYAVKFAEQVPDKLLDLVLSGKAGDEEWNALQHYSRIADGGAALDFSRSCFRALQQQPLIFYRRSMDGDPTAILRMADAMRYEFMAYENGSDANYKKYNAFFKQVLRKIAGEKKRWSGEALNRHKKFLRESRKEFENWKRRYERISNAS